MGFGYPPKLVQQPVAPIFNSIPPNSIVQQFRSNNSVAQVLAPNTPELWLLKFLPLTYHHSHFLATILDFTSYFSPWLFWGLHSFLQLGCFGLDHFIWTLRTTPIQLVSVLFIAVLYIVPNLI